MAKKQISTIESIRAAALAAYKSKHRFCSAMSQENNPCWHELNPYEDLMKITERITDQDVAEILSRPVGGKPETYIELSAEQMSALTDLKAALNRCESLGIAANIHPSNAR